MKSEIENEKAIETIANHAAKHLKSEYMLTFLEGDSYRCRFDNSEFCDNGEELGSPGFEEWYEIDFRVIETLKEGPNKDPRFDFVVISRKHMPLLVTCDGVIVYQG